MDKPAHLGALKLFSYLAAALGVLFGIIEMLGALAMLRHGLAVGLLSLAPGLLTILGALAGLGLVLAFIALVEAAVDTRNLLFELQSDLRVERIEVASAGEPELRAVGAE